VTTHIRIDERRAGDVTVLRLAGRLELEEGDIELRDCVNALVDEGRVKLVLDMREVTRLDSAGIGMLVSKLLTVRKRGGTIKLLHLTRRTDHLLEITKLSTVFEIFDDEAAAIQSFGPATAGG
jgi:anti-sigma B factor antagonist